MCGRIDYCNSILRSFGRSHITKQCACSTAGAITLPPFLRFRVDGRKRFEYATCGREFFFKNGGKNLRSQKYPYTCGQGPISKYSFCKIRATPPPPPPLPHLNVAISAINFIGNIIQENGTESYNSLLG